MWRLIDSVKFSDYRSKFQKQLLFDVKNIKKSRNIVVPADKTRNYYEVNPRKYEEMLMNNITANYKKCDLDMANIIKRTFRTIQNAGS